MLRLDLVSRLLASACLCLALPASAAVDSVFIASVDAKTGQRADGESSQAYADGLRYALDELNQQGGLLGKRVELVELDSGGSAEGARAAARAIVKLRPLGVIGEPVGAASLAMAPALQRARIPMISPKSTLASLTRVGNYIFRACYQDAAQGRALADFARKQLKAGSAAILTNASRPSNIELARHFAKYFRANGGTALEKAYRPGPGAHADLIERILKLAPDVVLLAGDARDSGSLMQSLRGRGARAVFLGGDGWGMRIPSYAGAGAEGSYRAAHWHRDNPNQASQAFLANYERRFGRTGAESAALAYDAVQLLAAAVRRSGSFAPERVRAALADTRHFAGVTGDISIDARRNPVKPVAIVQWRGGRDQFVTAITPQ